MAFNSELYNEVKASTNIITGDEYKQLFCAIAQVVTDLVSQTLGPYGSTTIIDDGTGFTYPTKDGWSCMNRLRFNDPIYNTIFGIIKQVSFNSVSTVGDGTTSAMVATTAFLDALYNKLIPELKEAKIYRQATLVEVMNEVTTELTNTLQNSKNVHHIDNDSDFRDIYKIAFIATNGHHQFASMIQNIYKETKNPNIRVEIDNGAGETTYRIEKGYRFDCKPIAFMSYINDEAGIVRKDDKPSKVITFDHNITYQLHKTIITSISQMASATNMDYIILAPYFDDIVCSIIQNNAEQMRRNGQIPNIMLVQIPTTMDMHQAAIRDIAALTNSVIFTETLSKVFNTLHHNATVENQDDIIHDSVMDLPQFKKYEYPQAILEDVSGTAKSIIFEKSEGFIQDYEEYYNEAEFTIIKNEAKEIYEKKRDKAVKTINGMLDKDYLFAQLRYIKLLGNCGVIKVGGVSDIQKRCDKDSLDDATLACRSAYEHGYVRGMCLEIITACEDYLRNNIKIPTDYKWKVYDAISNAFFAVFKAVLYNKYGESENANEMNSKILIQCIRDNTVYNLRKDTFDNPDDWSVINSVQTDIEILTAMSNILTMIMTSNQFLTMNRSCDIKVSREKALEQRIEDESAIVIGKTRAFFDTIAETEYKNGFTLGLYPFDPSNESE